jgi:single-stranded-DNA-specific exonuclease
MKWNTKSNKIPTNIKELQDIILENREIPKDQLETFINPVHPKEFSLEDLDINKAEYNKSIKIIKKAIKDDTKIVIFGDYDVDGISASAILWQVLFKMYKESHSEGKNHPVPFIPHREKHGYGINQKAIDEIIESHNPKLIITVDNGIVAHEPISYAKSKGIDVILTDHHQPELKNDKPDLPDATCIVHTSKICGAGVAWMLAKGLDEELTLTMLDLAGIATIADQVPLLDANRSFATFGIKQLRESNNLGLREICKIAKIKQEEISAGNIGYAISPRINAMGRLEHGLDALRLLCTKNNKQASDLAKLLNDTNFTRQDMTKLMLDEAKLQLDEIEEENIIIVHSETFHEGILGLIAGRLAERHNKPAIAIYMGKDIAKASARSVSGVDVVKILREIKSDLTAVGGHPMAAGFSFLPKNLKTIKTKLFKIAKEKINESQLEKSLKLDCEIPASLVNAPAIESLNKFSPYGMKNPQPVVSIKNLKILDVRLIGKSNEHLKLKLVDSTNEDGVSFDCLGWRMSERFTNLEQDNVISIAGTLDINDWNNRQYPQVILKDVKD